MPAFHRFGRLDAFARATEAAALSAKAASLGHLPEWNLADLYPSMESPVFASDLARAEAECKAFAETYRGKLAALAEADGGQGLAEAVKRYEALDDLLGRIMSFASLAYSRQYERSGARQILRRHAGEDQYGLDRASVLPARTQPARRCDHRETCPQDALAHYRPWLEDIRKDKPYELADEIERLFHEKSVTGRSAWNRLFDETHRGAALQRERRRAGGRARAQSDAGPEGGGAQGRGRGDRRDLEGEWPHFRP